jgi:pimeloyl-ACP methyl ester carboxylesterase
MAMHITHWGTEGPRIVLVHGSAQGSAVGGDLHFSTQQALGSRGFQLDVPDRPGHGKTPSPGRPDDAALDGALVAELLGNGAHLVGHSFGGCVAIAAAAQRPQAVRSLTLIEPATMRMAMHVPVVRRFGFSMLKILFLSFRPEQRIRRFAELVNIPPEIAGGSDAVELRRMGVAIRRLKLPSGRSLVHDLDVIRAAGIPLLVVTGGWNPAFEAAADVAAAAGGGERVVIASEHHFPQLVSDEFNQRLAAFVTAAEPVLKG